ncbi:MAG: T9SS type A sorting domain-containing protein, partial [Bacteroidia bacterium]|nr:T9SS type A sorting domain-containing protein [Bacteroidia bacterium]
AIQASLYPNPSAGTSVLEASQALVRVRIWDLQGRLVWEAAGDSPRWELTSPSKGIFFVEGWTRSGEQVHLRWVVE